MRWKLSQPTGEQKFATCDVKRVTFRMLYKDKNDRGDVWQSQMPDAQNIEIAPKAVLDCPKSPEGEISSSVTANKQLAIKTLGQIAGGAVCASCRYANMTATEVFAEETARMQAETAMLRAQAELATTQAEHDRIVAELQQPTLPAIEQ